LSIGLVTTLGHFFIHLVYRVMYLFGVEFGMSICMAVSMFINISLRATGEGDCYGLNIQIGL
jgi:hypothetical protein